jgi:hypothetical protein
MAPLEQVGFYRRNLFEQRHTCPEIDYINQWKYELRFSGTKTQEIAGIG